MTFYASSPRRDAPPAFDQTAGDITLADIARVLKRARRWIIAAGIVGGAVAGAVAYNLPPYYQAEGILVGSGAGAPPARAEGAPRQDAPGVIAPAALRRMVEAPERMKRIAEAVLRSYPPQQDADWLALARQRALELLGLPPERGQPAIDKMRGLLSANLVLRPEDDSGTLTLLYQDTDARRAADIANLIMRLIVADHRDIQIRNSVEMEASLEARLAALRDEIAAETRALSRMRQASGMDVMPAGTVLDQRISEAVRTLAVQSAQLAAAQARFDRAKRSVERGSIANTDQGTTLSPLLEDLYQKRAAAVRSESYLDPQIGPQHPTRKGLAEERRKLDVAIKAELDRVLYELGEAVSAATVREQNARADLALLRAQSEQVLPRRLEVGAAERHLASLQAAHDELLRERQRLLVIQEGGGDAVRIAAPAVPPQLAAGPRKKPAILMGGAVSAVFAAIIALFRGVMAGQSASSERYRAVVGAAEVYEFSALPGRTARRAWRGLAGERRALQTSVPREARNVASWLLSRRERFGHGVVVSSPDAREGKTLISALLAMGAASLGARTLLVDGDFYAKATVSNLKRAKALGEVEASGPESPAGSPIYRTGLTNLWACPLEGHLVDLVSTGRSDGLQRWLANLSSDFDLIIIDAPPLLSTIGATVLARAAPINVMVHDTSRSSIAELAEAAKLYRMFNITTDMLILNRFRGKAKSYRRYSDFPLKDSRDASAGGALVSPYRHPPQGGPV